MCSSMADSTGVAHNEANVGIMYNRYESIIWLLHKQ